VQDESRCGLMSDDSRCGVGLSEGCLLQECSEGSVCGHADETVWPYQPEPPLPSALWEPDLAAVDGISALTGLQTLDLRLVLEA
jgi:hypothetical protein